MYTIYKTKQQNIIITHKSRLSFDNPINNPVENMYGYDSLYNDSWDDMLCDDAISL